MSEILSPAAVRDPMDPPERSNAGPPVPDAPLVLIAPPGRWTALDLRELWNGRELLYFLIWRDVKVRYKQTLLGAAWAIIQPLFAMIVFSLFFGRLAGVPSNGLPYPLFAYAGLLPWTFFSNAVTASGNSLVGSAHLITKVYFPRIAIPTAAVAAGLVDFAIASLLLIPLMLYFNVRPGLGLLLTLPLMALTALLALGVGLWISAWNVRYRDLRYALPFFIQLWLFVSPVIYPTSMIPERWRPWLALNPLTGLIEAYRAAVFGRPCDLLAFLIAVGITALVLVLAARAFARMEQTFADLV